MILPERVSFTPRTTSTTALMASCSTMLYYTILYYESVQFQTMYTWQEGRKEGRKTCCWRQSWTLAPRRFSFYQMKTGNAPRQLSITALRNKSSLGSLLPALPHLLLVHLKHPRCAGLNRRSSSRKHQAETSFSGYGTVTLHIPVFAREALAKLQEEIWSREIQRYTERDRDRHRTGKESFLDTTIEAVQVVGAQCSQRPGCCIIIIIIIVAGPDKTRPDQTRQRKGKSRRCS